MYIERFIAHQTPAKARVFALTNVSDYALQAVTTLSGDHTRFTAELVDALNLRIFEKQVEGLNGVLERLPGPVQTSIRRFFDDVGAPDPYSYTEMGPIKVVREFYFGDRSKELLDFLEAAYMIGLGVRISNEIDGDGDIGWNFELRSEEAFVPAGADPRSWPLPGGRRSIRAWTSREPTGGDPARAALTIAREASKQNKYVRVHTFACGISDDPSDMITSEIAVDVFDAPIPLMEGEDAD